VSESEIDRAQLLAAARSYLEWEAEISGFGLPPFEARARAFTHAAASAATAQASGPAGTAAVSAVVEPPVTRVVPVAPPPSRAIAAPLSSAPSAGTAALPVAHGDKRARLALLDEQVRGCARCELAKGRTHTVFARGNPDSPVVFVGEGPGQEEDRLGAPFVGAAGQLLDKMIGAMGFARDDVYICNVVKCRPPGNRTPLPAEAAACAPFLLSQLEAVAPRVIVALGRCAAENMGLVQGGGWRGRWGTFRGVDVMPTYHPAFLLRSPEFKRPVWEDLQLVMGRLKQPS
jgi:uracil-DNA glycosylase family 4